MEKSVEFYDVYDYYYQPLLQRNSLKIALVFAVLLILVFLTFFIINRFLKKKNAKALTPWQSALAKLQSLSLDKCQTKADYKKFYFDLTSILKNYLNRRFEWQTEDKTDEELLIFLEKQNFDTDLLEKLKILCQQALCVKFADEDALKFQAQKDLDVVHQIVKKTIPQES